MTIRLAIAQQPFPVGDIAGNTKRLLHSAEQAMAQEADLVVFPELSLVGYPPEDLLLRPSLAERIQQALAQLCAEKLPIAMVVGYPETVDSVLYNAAMVIHNGQIIARYRKQHLPNYQVFDEKRYFSEGHENGLFELKGVTFALTICEDIWCQGPAQRAAQAGGAIHLNLNGSPYYRGRPAERQAHLNQIAQQTGMTSVYVNHVGGQDELVFDGASFVSQYDGQLATTLPIYEACLHLCELAFDGQGWAVTNPQFAKTLSPEAELYGALKLGLADYVNRNGFKGVVLGLSGGIDSALSAAIAVDALGSDRVMAVMMPYQYTAQMSREDAELEAKWLTIRYQELPLKAAVDATHQSLKPLLAVQAADVTAQNIQSRLRGVFLMALSNQWGYMVLSTGNKSELAVGYATLYGDMCGGYNALKDVTKTWVYRLARWRNQQTLVIPERVIERAPSAELAPEQKDEDSLPPYPILDAIIEGYVEQDKSLDQLIDAGFERLTLERVIGLIDRNEYKRRQAPEGVRVTPRGFGRDRRYPITHGWQPGI